MQLVSVEIRPVADRFLVTASFCSRTGLGYQELTMWANTLSQAQTLSKQLLRSGLTDEKVPA